MAIRITRIDDIDGSEGAEAINFGLNHVVYEIDLAPRNRAKFLRMIRPFIERAREVESNEPVPAPPATRMRRHAEPEAIEEEQESVELPLHLAEPVSDLGDRDLIEMARQIQT